VEGASVVPAVVAGSAVTESVEAAVILVGVTEIAVAVAVGEIEVGEEIASVAETSGVDGRVAVLTETTTFSVGAGSEEGSTAFGATTCVGLAASGLVAQPRRSMSKRIAIRTRVTTNLNRS
jgi:hypothetical protein